jgi:hypothetical protein
VKEIEVPVWVSGVTCLRKLEKQREPFSGPVTAFFDEMIIERLGPYIFKAGLVTGAFGTFSLPSTRLRRGGFRARNPDQSDHFIAKLPEVVKTDAGISLIQEFAEHGSFLTFIETPAASRRPRPGGALRSCPECLNISIAI